ncbi:MAG: NAD(P)-dependent oxidoreductase [Candidatus Limnocylindrales bacterium]
MRVLVIGASGVIGRQLVPQLLAAGHEVVATARSARNVEFADPAARLRTLDLLDGAAVRSMMAEVRPDTVVHQATALSGMGTDMRHFDQLFATTNRLRTEGTANLLAAADEAGGPRLISQSYCGWPWAPVGAPVKSEDDPLDDHPARSFSRTLQAIRELETMVVSYPKGVVLRYGSLYGPGTSLSDGGDVIAAIRRRRLPLVGDGGGVWSFTHVEDAASAAMAALTRGRGVYNIVDDRPAAAKVWVPYLAALLGAPPPLRLPKWLARLVGGDLFVRIMTDARGSSNAKARRELGWQPRFPDWRIGFTEDLAVAAG